MKPRLAGRTLLSAWLGLALFGAALPAQAFCRTRGCDPNTMGCQPDASGCLSEGPILHWASSCVSFDVQKEGSALRGISYAAANQAIVAGFSQWLNADCDGQAPAIEISDFGAVECRKAEYNQDAGNANVFMFRDSSWPYDNAIDTLALTTLIFNADNGEIYDADVEVNSYESDMAVGDVGRTDIDFASVITHEIGHFLGLSHSTEPGATMRPSYVPGNTSMASIDPDDAAGICSALPPGRATSNASCEPRHGFSSECAVEDSGCATAPGRPASGSSALLALLGAGAALTLSRRRLRRASPLPAAGPRLRRGPGSAS